MAVATLRGSEVRACGEDTASSSCCACNNWCHEQLLRLHQLVSRAAAAPTGGCSCRARASPCAWPSAAPAPPSPPVELQVRFLPPLVFVFQSSIKPVSTIALNFNDPLELTINLTPPPLHGFTHGQQSAAKGSLTTVSRSDIRLIQYLDSSAHGLVRRWRLIGYSLTTYSPLLEPTQLTQPCNYTVVHHYRYTRVHHFRYAHGDDSTPLAPR
jgi:hypothetical protein